MEKHEIINYTILWKPLMVLGVPWDYLFFAISISPITGVLIIMIGEYVFGVNPGGIFCIFAVFGCFLLYGRIRAKEDPEFMTIHLTRLKYMKKTKGPGKGNVYHA